MKYEFIPMPFNKQLAYSVYERVLRLRTKKFVRGLKKDSWNIDYGCACNSMRVEYDVWIPKDASIDRRYKNNVVCLEGMTPDQVNNRLPIIATGLTSRLLASATMGRRSWKIDEDNSIRNDYFSSAENGEPFSIEEETNFRNDVKRSWYNEINILVEFLPQGLYEQLDLIIKDFSSIKSKEEGTTYPAEELSNLMLLLKPDKRNKAIDLLNELGNRTGSKAAEIVIKYIDYFLEESEILNSRFFGAMKQLNTNWTDDKLKNWNKYIKLNIEKRDKRKQVETMVKK